MEFDKEEVTKPLRNSTDAADFVLNLSNGTLYFEDGIRITKHNNIEVVGKPFPIE